MGSALLRGVAAAFGKKNVEAFLSDVNPAAVDALHSALECRSTAARPDEAAAEADAVILAVKPQDMKAVCESLARVKGERLHLSIAAGITLGDLELWLGKRQRVIRVMPNTPALVGCGAAAFARGKNATEADARLTRQILGSTGIAEEVSEDLLDAVTGLSGSGPAYVYTFIEALADGGVLMGLPRAAALQLAAQTVLGAAKMVQQTGRHPSVLRDEVTSPGGTTIAGMEQIESAGMRKAVLKAVRAATERAREMGRK